MTFTHSLPSSPPSCFILSVVLALPLTLPFPHLPSPTSLPSHRSLADDVCSMQEAKDIFPSLGMIANVGLILAGAWAKFVNQHLAGERRVPASW